MIRFSRMGISSGVTRIRGLGRVSISPSEMHVPSAGADLCADTTMAEYHTYGPGFNAAGRRLAANVTMELTKAQFEPYSTPEKVFQFPFQGVFGNTAWIDKHA